MPIFFFYFYVITYQAKAQVQPSAGELQYNLCFGAHFRERTRDDFFFGLFVLFNMYLDLVITAILKLLLKHIIILKVVASIYMVWS